MIDRRSLMSVGLAAPLAGGWFGAGRVFAQTPNSPALQRPTPQPGDTQPKPEGEGEADTTLATTDTASSHILAPVTVNGQGPFQFLVDTGANRSAIGSVLATRLNLPSGPNMRLHTVAGARMRPTAVVDSLQVGDRIQRRLRVPTFPISGMEADGVLGVDWLKGRRLAFDFKSKRLDITGSRNDELNPAQIANKSAVLVPARLRLGQITIVDADMSGRKISAMIDTGGQLSLGNGALREQIRRFQEPGKSQQIDLLTVTGERLTGELLYVPFIRLGGLLLGNVPIVFAKVHVFDLWNMERNPAIILGMDLLRQFDAIAMDFGRARVRFDLTT
jgi:hypothetical protein